jgi:hypothetical protein
MPKKEPKKATAKEHLTGVRSVPAGDVLDAVMIFRTNNFNRRDCLLSPVSFSPFLSLNLFTQPLFSASLLMTNDQ